MTSEERLERLEKELALTKRRIRRLLQGFICLFVAGCVFAVLLSTLGSVKAQGEKVIRANEFVLEDQTGKPRAKLSMTHEGPGLSLFDLNGKRRLIVSFSNIGPGVVILGQNDNVRAVLQVGETGPGLRLCNPNGEVRTILSIDETGPGLTMSDQNGKMRAWLNVANEGPSLDLYDKNGKGRATVGTSMAGTPDGKTISYPESSVLLFGPDEKVIWVAP